MLTRAREEVILWKLREMLREELAREPHDLEQIALIERVIVTIEEQKKLRPQFRNTGNGKERR